MVINPAAFRALVKLSGRSLTSIAADLTERTGTTYKQPHLSLIAKGDRGASAELTEALAEVLDVEIGALICVSEDEIVLRRRARRKRAQRRAAA